MFSSYSGCLYNKDATTLFRVPEGKTSISFPNTVTSIGYYAFNNTAMASVRLPYGVKTIQNCAFANTPQLDYCYIPSSVTSLAGDIFWKTKNNIYLYCNMATPPTIYPEAMFGITLSNARLYVPYGKVDAYKSAGWTGFSAYNSSDVQAQDAYISGLGYTVTTTASQSINGTSYNGRVKVVSYGYANNSSVTTVDIPASVTISGKTYAVTRIGEDAFNNHSTNFTVTGCANVDTVDVYAFQNQPVTSYAFTHNLKYVMKYAFDGAGLTGTIALPYGIKVLEGYSFANGKYSRLIVPSSISNMYGSFCNNTTTLTELVLNFEGKTWYNYTGWSLGTVPSTCYIRVPVGVVNHYKQNSSLSSRANYITAGAYDFPASFSNGSTTPYNGNYMVTVTSTASTTYNGKTYAGKAKYVYTPNVTGRDFSGWPGDVMDKTVTGDTRTYLITEMGDSLLMGSKVKTIEIPGSVTRIGHNAYYNVSTINNNNLTLPSGLTYIGANAFRGTGVKGEIKIPSTVTYIDHDAFWNVASLTALYFPGDKPATLGNDAWYSGSNLTVWVPNQYAYNYLTEANKWGSSRAERLAVWIMPTNATATFGSCIPVNMAGSGINAYYASGYDKSNTGKEVTLTKANQAPANTGLLLTDLTVNKEYRIIRPTSSVSAPMTNYLIANTTASSITRSTPNFFWRDDSKCFKTSSSFTVRAGMCYLQLSSTEASGKTEVYTNLWPKPNDGVKGDANGDGIVDISDVSLVINMMLGKSGYQQNCDMNNDGKIDITDVNMVINKMLGK